MKKLAIIACQALEPELEHIRAADSDIEITYLEQHYHNTPDLLPQILQELIDKTSCYAEKIVLGYGLCSNAISGIIAPAQGIIVPKCHDCIALFLGGHDIYKKEAKERPGTFYLTPGWVNAKADPLGFMEEKCVPKMGREAAEFGAALALEHYSYIAFINTFYGEIDKVRLRAKENALFFKKNYKELNGTLNYFKKIIHGPHDEKYFFFFRKGEIINSNIFLEECP